MSETTVVIKEVKALKSGTSGKGEWNLYGVLDGNDDIIATTFDATLFNNAKQFVGKRAVVRYEEDAKGKKLVSVSVDPNETNGSTPALGTGGESDGRKENISRAVALKAAVALATHTIPSAATPKEMVNSK